MNYTDATTLTVGSLTTAGINTTNNLLTLETGDALTVGSSVNVGTSTAVFQVAKNGVNQTGNTITAKNLELQITVLPRSLKQRTISTSSRRPPQDPSKMDVDDLTVGQVNATKGVNTGGKDVLLTTGGNLQLLQDVNTASTGIVTFVPGSGGARKRLDQCWEWDCNSAAEISPLNQAGNDVKTFAADVNGPLTFRDANSLTLGTVGLTSGIKTNSNLLNLRTGIQS